MHRRVLGSALILLFHGLACTGGRATGPATMEAGPPPLDAGGMSDAAPGAPGEPSDASMDGAERMPYAAGDAGQAEDAALPNDGGNPPAALRRATLTALRVEGTQLMPSFDPDVLEYSVELPLPTLHADVSAQVTPSAALRIAGSPVDDVALWRSPELQTGDNPVELQVTQPNHEPQTYLLHLRRTTLPQCLPALASANHWGVRVALSDRTLAMARRDAQSGRILQIWLRDESGLLQQEAELHPGDCPGVGFPGSLALDGDTLAIGCAQAGVVLVYTRTEHVWSAPLELHAQDGMASEMFGGSVDVSGDTLVIGAPSADVDDGQGGTISQAGAAYVFRRSGDAWQQAARLHASNAGNADHFGAAVTVHGDSLAVSAPYEDSASTGVNGSGSDDGAADSGAAYVFVRDGDSWLEQAYLKTTRATPGYDPQLGGDQFGGGDQLSGPGLALWGDVLAVGAPAEDTVVDPDAQDPHAHYAYDTGAVYLFARSAGQWSPEGRLEPSSQGHNFGSSVSLWGERLIIGAWQNDSVGAGLNAAASLAAPSAGSAFSFTRSMTGWTQTARLGAARPEAEAYFGWSVAVSERAQAVGAGNAGLDEVCLFP